MSCEEFESRILDYQENNLSPVLRREVETHVACCAGCGARAREFQELDRLLSGGIKIPVLSRSFERRLGEQIDAAPIFLTEAKRAERQRQLQSEFEAGLARLCRGSFSAGRLLDRLTQPALGAMAAWLVWGLAPLFTGHLTAHSLGGIDPALLRSLAACAVFLAIGLPEVLARAWKSP